MGLISLIVGGAMDAHKAIKQSNAQDNDEVNRVVVKGLYSMDVPTFLSERDDLSEDASLQYGNNTLDIALQVLDEPKDEFLEALEELDVELPTLGEHNTPLDKMATMTICNYYDDLDKVEINDYEETRINGLRAVTVNGFQKRTFFNDAVFTSFAFIEGRETMYQIMVVSGGSSISKLAEKMDKCIYSFREL